MKAIPPAVVIFLLTVQSFGGESPATGPLPLALGEEPAHLVKVLRTTNKAQTNRYVPKVYEFKHVNPYAVVRFYRRVLEIEEGRFATFVAPDGHSGLVLVVAPAYQIPYLDKLMAILDRPGLTTSDHSGRMYTQLKYRAADDVGLLRTLWGETAHTGSRPPHGTRAGDIKIICDLETNAIYYKGAPSEYEKARTLLKDLDTPLPQVLVEATLYEIELNNNGKIGFDYYAWKNGPGRNLFAFGAFAEYEKVDRLKGGVNIYNSGFNTYGLPHHRFRNHGYNVAYFFDVPTAYFDFLVAKGVARVITSGRIVSKIPSNYKSGLNAFGQGKFDPERDTVSLEGGAARFQAADQVLYYRTVTGPSPRAGARPPGFMLDPYGDTIAYPDNRTLLEGATPLSGGGTSILGRTIEGVDVGTSLEVLPRIAAENILLNLKMEVSSLLGFDGEGRPQISARRASSVVRLRNGEQIVFGGLERTSRIQSTRKFPLLGSIPVIGWAFGGESSGVKKTVVFAVVRATRLPTGLPEQMQRVVDQVKGDKPTPLPADRFGFDQWLLDR